MGTRYGTNWILDGCCGDFTAGPAGGIREPLIVRWPGTAKDEGQRRLQPVSLMDLFATAAAAAGADAGAPRSPHGEAARAARVAVDGIDLAPVLASVEAPGPHEESGLFHWRGDTVMAVRLGAHKVHFFTEGCALYCFPSLKSHAADPLVFQIEHDPGEAYPLDPRVDAAAAAAVQAAVRARDAHVLAVGALPEAELNRCDPAGFTWAPDYPVPPSHPYICVYGM
jgi:arylsulfatase A-like enzyme